MYRILLCLTICLLTSGICWGASSSQSCFWGSDGVYKCVSNNDPNGNGAVAAAGGNGQVFSGTGGPGGWNTNFGQFGFPGFPGNMFPYGPQLPQLPYYGRR